MQIGSSPWFVDTNILVYSVDPADSAKQARAVLWLNLLIEAGLLVLSPQSLNELYNVLRRKVSDAGRSRVRASVEFVVPWVSAPLDVDTMRLAWSIEDATGYQWFDCLLLAAAVRAGCTGFLSEDLSHGRTIGALTIVDPFRLTPAAFSTRP